MIDRGPGHASIMLRTPTSFGDARRTTAAPDADPASGSRVYTARWVDASGPTGEPPAGPPDGPPEEHPDAPGARRANEQGTGPVNGISVLDHPANYGFPNPVGKYATVQQLTQVHYPPTDAPDGPFSFQTRILVHDSDGAEANVDAVARDYAAPCGSSSLSDAAMEATLNSDEPRVLERCRRPHRCAPSQGRGSWFSGSTRASS